MANLISSALSKIQGVVSKLDRDQSMPGFQITPGGFSAGVQRVKQAFQSDPSKFWVASPSAQRIGINTLEQQVKPQLTNPFARTLTNVGTNILKIGESGGTDVSTGLRRTFQGDIAPGLAQTVRGAGKYATLTPQFLPSTLGITTAASLDKPIVQSDAIRRVGTGLFEGYTGVTPTEAGTQFKNVKLGPLEFDPLRTAGGMVGFIKNPVNAQLFKATNAILPGKDLGLKAWLGVTAARGGLENYLLNLPDRPEGLTPAQKAEWAIKNIGMGAIQEIGGQAIMGGITKGAKTLKLPELNAKLNKVAVDVFDNLSEVKRKWSIPVTKPGFGSKLGQQITAPMWKWEMGLVDDGSMQIFKSDIETPDLKVESTDPLSSLKEQYKNMTDENLNQSIQGLESGINNDFTKTPVYKALKEIQQERLKSGVKITEPIKQQKTFSLDGFGDNLDPKNKARLNNLLSSKTRINGGEEVMTKADYVRRLLSEGYEPKILNDKPILQSNKGDYYSVSKTEYDFANHLRSKNVPTDPLSSLKEEAAPKTVRVWNKSKFSNNGAYADIPVIRREDNITLYQGSSQGENRQFWTPDKKYAEQFGSVREKTGSFYKVDNGNRVADVYVEAPTTPNPLLQEAKKYGSTEEQIKKLLSDGQPRTLSQLYDEVKGANDEIAFARTLGKMSRSGEINRGQGMLKGSNYKTGELKEVYSLPKSDLYNQATGKLSQLEDMLDINRKPTGWKQQKLTTPQKEDLGIRLVNPKTGEYKDFTYKGNSGTELMKAKSQAQAYAIDNPIIRENVGGTGTENIITKPLYNQATGKAKLRVRPTETPKTPELPQLQTTKEQSLVPQVSKVGREAIKQAGEVGDNVLSSVDQVKPKIPSLKPTISKYAENINLNKLDIKPEEKAVLKDTVNLVKKELSKAKGKTLGNKEVIEAAKSSEMLTQVTTREQTLKANAEMLKARQKMVELDKKITGALSKGNAQDVSNNMRELIDSLRVVSAEAADRGRKLQSLSISAGDESVREIILKQISKVETDTDKILKEAVNVNWDNAKDVSQFYRKFIKPTATEILDEFRYNNMLSNPRTQIRNAFSNVVQTVITRPATIAATGDISGAAKYYGGMTKNIPSAVDEFIKTFRGEKAIDKPDVEMIPTYKLPEVMTIPSRLLEASDKFFTNLIMGGELARGATKEQAEQLAAYSLFRQDLKPKNQGHLLNAIDNATEGVYQMGKKIPLLRWFVPFVRTPMNFAKQWIEYSPAGIATTIGSGAKREQLAKTMLGSAVTLMGAQAALQGRTTWAAPTDPKEKELFYASGRKPFSVKIGDKWVSMMYAGPFAMALALPAAMQYYQNENRTALTDSQLEKFGKVVGSMSEFLSGQTFLEGLGNFVSLIKGDADYTLGKNVAYTGGQFVPMQGLVRWITTAIDPVYRKAKTPLDQFKSGIPFMSETLQPYTDPLGNISTREPQNLVTPYDITSNKPEWESKLKTRQSKLQENAVLNQVKKDVEQSKSGQEAGNNYVYWDNESNSAKTIKLDWQEPSLPKLTGTSEWDKKLISNYKSDITSRQSDIMTLYEQGQMTEQQAMDEYLKLDELKKTATNKAKAPKKIKIKSMSLKIPKTKLAKFKISKSKSLRSYKPKKIKARSIR